MMSWLLQPELCREFCLTKDFFKQTGSVTWFLLSLLTWHCCLKQGGFSQDEEEGQGEANVAELGQIPPFC